MSTNAKTILAASLAVVFVVSMMILPVAASGHLTITDSTVYKTGGTLNAIITTSADIPVDGSTDFGYAFPIDDGSGRLLAAATQGGIGKDSSGQGKDINAMHTNIVTLQ